MSIYPYNLYYLQQPTGSISIMTSPSGAKIFIDGQERLETTPAFIDIPVGTHTYKLTYPGHIDEDGLIFIEEGKTYDIFLIMKQPTISMSTLVASDIIGSAIVALALFFLIRKSYIEYR